MEETDAIKTLRKLQEQLRAIKPLQRADIEALARQAHEEDPKLQKLDREIRQRKAIDAHLQGGQENMRDRTTAEPEV